MKRRLNHRQTICLIAAVVSALTTLLASAQNTQAQWTTGTNISNTNSGTVSVGTSSSVEQLTVANGSPSGLGVYRDLDVTSVGAAGVYFNLGARNGSTFTIGAQLTGVLDNPATAGYLVFSTRDSSSLYERMRISANGNVGIGTTSPESKLQVTIGDVSSVGVRSNLGLFINGGGYSGNVQQIGFGYGAGLTNVPTALGQIVTADSGYTKGALFFATRNVDTDTAPTERMRIDAAGNVGIGTTSPSSKLEVYTASADASGTAISITGGVAGNRDLDFRGVHVSSDASNKILGRIRLTNDGSYSQSGDLAFFTGQNDGANNITLGERMRVTSSGNVGIGTTSPVRKLTIDAASTPDLGFYTSGIERVTLRGTSAASFQVDTAGSPRMTIDASGNVGIGATSPSAKLDVGGSIYTTGQIRANNLSLIMWGTDASGTNRVLSGAPNLESQDAQGLELGTSTGAPIVLYTGASERMRIDSSGNTIVTGNINLTGTINAKYQDVAEWVPSSEQLAAGTVVVLDSTKSNQVTSSSVSYDTRVAGVISVQPGIALGEKSDSKVLVATTGRVKVKVDASKSPIHIGDLLVTSDVPGMAMKSEPIMIGGRQIHGPGTLIGKALEPLEKGSGEILVLLSLQ